MRETWNKRTSFDSIALSHRPTKTTTVDGQIGRVLQMELPRTRSA